MNLNSAVVLCAMLLGATGCADEAGHSAPGTGNYPNGGMRRTGSIQALLPIEADNISCAVIDNVNGYAYFGLDTQPGGVLKVKLTSGLAAPQVIGVCTFNSGENNPRCASIDLANQFAYFGCYQTRQIVKVSLGAGDALPSRNSAVTTSCTNVLSMDIDTAKQYLYVGDSAAKLHRISIPAGSAPTVSTVISLSAAHSNVTATVFDPNYGFAYLVCGTNSNLLDAVELYPPEPPPPFPQIAPIDVIDYTVPYHVNFAIPDFGNNVAYFGGYDGTGPLLFKVAFGATQTSQPTFPGQVSLGASADIGAFDATNNAIYIVNKTASGTAPTLTKILGNQHDDAPTLVGSIVLPASDSQISAMAANTASGKVLLGTDSAPANVIQVFPSQAGSIRATKFTLPATALVTDVRFHTQAASGSLQLAIYDDASPKNLVWQSASMTVSVDNGEIIVPINSGTPSRVAIQPGMYWLAWETNATVNIGSYTPGNAGDGFIVDQAYGPSSRIARSRRADRDHGCLDRVHDLRRRCGSANYVRHVDRFRSGCVGKFQHHDNRIAGAVDYHVWRFARRSYLY